ncbi:MAG: hydrolase [Bacteroidota bacterium]|nr:hydrolase [Bacteroidota bacterium]
MKHFNVRVYGILVLNNKVLVCDELIKGHEVTKFPGGGLEHGEGTVDCLKREFMEETNQEIKVTEHFYTTDYYQQSAYNPNHQILSIYYIVKPVAEFKVKSTEKIFDFEGKKTYIQTFRWLELDTISGNDFTLPIDKIVGDMLAQKLKKP